VSGRRLHGVSLVALGICIGLLIAVTSAVALNRATLAELFGPGMIRAQVVVYANGQDTEIWFARGRILAIGGGGLTLREKDGQVDRIEVASGARITLNGSFVPLSSLRRGMQVQAFRPGDAPAYRVDATR
jgi:hypothetical protein